MLKMLTLSNFNLVSRDMNNGDYSYVLNFTPKSKEEQTLGLKIVEIVLPYTFGISDTMVSDTEYDCTIIYDDSVAFDQSMIAKFAFFTRKLNSKIEVATPKESKNIVQTMDVTPSDKIRSIKSPNGDSKVNVYDNTVEIVGGKNRLIVSDEKISVIGNFVENNLPAKDCVLFVETGFLRLFPKCFIPPMSVPDYLPNIQFVMKVKVMMQLAESLAKIGSAVSKL